MQSFKAITKRAIETISAYGYKLTNKISAYDQNSVRSYSKNSEEGCMLLARLDTTSALLITFCTQYFTAVPSAQFVLKFHEDGHTESLSIDLTSNSRYACILRALTTATHQGGNQS